MKQIFSVVSEYWIPPYNMNYWFCLDILFYTSYRKNVTVSLIDMLQSSLNMSRRLLWSTQGVRKPLDLYTSWMFDKADFFQHFSFCFLLSVLRHVQHPLTCSGPDPCWVEWGELPSSGDPRSFFETTVLSWDANVARKWVDILNRAVCDVSSRISWKWKRRQQHLITFITLSSLLSPLSLYELMTGVWRDWRLSCVHGSSPTTTFRLSVAGSWSWFK